MPQPSVNSNLAFPHVEEYQTMDRSHLTQTYNFSENDYTSSIPPDVEMGMDCAPALLDCSMELGACGSDGVIQRRPRPVGKFQNAVVKPIMPFLNNLYLRVLRMQHLACNVSVFHMQSIYLARQALHLVIRLNDAVDVNEGPSDEQYDERNDLEDEMIEVFEAMTEWGCDNEDEFQYEHCILKIKQCYALLFKERFYFHDVRDCSMDPSYQKAAAYDAKTIRYRQCQRIHVTSSTTVEINCRTEPLAHKPSSGIPKSGFNRRNSHLRRKDRATATIRIHLTITRLHGAHIGERKHGWRCRCRSEHYQRAPARLPASNATETSPMDISLGTKDNVGTPQLSECPFILETEPMSTALINDLIVSSFDGAGARPPEDQHTASETEKCRPRDKGNIDTCHGKLEATLRSPSIVQVNPSITPVSQAAVPSAGPARRKRFRSSEPSRRASRKPNHSDPQDMLDRISNLLPFGRRIMGHYAGNESSGRLRTLEKIEEYKRQYDEDPIKGSGTQWECKISGCTHAFISFQKAAIHLTTHEWKLRSWHCPGISCQRVYGSSNELTRHMKDHPTSPTIRPPEAAPALPIMGTTHLFRSTQTSLGTSLTPPIELFSRSPKPNRREYGPASMNQASPLPDPLGTAYREPLRTICTFTSHCVRCDNYPALQGQVMRRDPLEIGEPTGYLEEHLHSPLHLVAPRPHQTNGADEQPTNSNSPDDGAQYQPTYEIERFERILLFDNMDLTVTSTSLPSQNGTTDRSQLSPEHFGFCRCNICPKNSTKAQFTSQHIPAVDNRSSTSDHIRALHLVSSREAIQGNAEIVMCDLCGCRTA